MDTQHAALIKRSYDEPDERRTPPRSTVDVVHLGNVSSARLTLEPGSALVGVGQADRGRRTCVRSTTSGWSSRAASASRTARTAWSSAPGDTYVIEPGHDAWVVGDESFVGYEFDSRAADTYATTG